MKVYELIEQLQNFPEETEVYVSYDYGDYWHTTVAAQPKDVELQRIEMSDYHRMMTVIEPPDDATDEEYAEELDKGEPAVVIAL